LKRSANQIEGTFILYVAAKLLSNQNVTSMRIPIVEEFSVEILSMLIYGLPVYVHRSSFKKGN